MKNKTVLVVEDDPGILDATKFILEDEGYDVITTETGEYAENLHKTKNLPDLIILDVLLSGKDGREICKQLKSQEVTRDIPVIMISAQPGAGETVRQAGANSFLAKPFDVSSLVEEIERYI